MCSGKVYFELRQMRQELGCNHVGIVRIEQLYPFPEMDLGKVLKPYANLLETVWCQEEPQNQGAWYASQHHMRRVIFRHNPEVYLEYAGRDAAAAPAAGYTALHLIQQDKLVRDALGTDQPRLPI